MGAVIYNILAVIGWITVFSVVVMFVIMGIEAIISVRLSGGKWRGMKNEGL